MISPIIIRSVKISNILSHVQTYVEFPLGLTALVGPNGAGKSSIIDSIIYALFIAPQNIKSLRGTSRRGFLRIGASTGSIEVELDVGGRKYAVHRIVSVSKGDEAFLYEVSEDGKKKLVASGVQQVLDYIRNIMSIPSVDSVRYTIISRQNEIAELLNVLPAERKELILKLLGLKELEKSKDILKQYLKQIEVEEKVLEDYKIELNNVRKRIQDLKFAIEQGRVDMKKLEEEMKILEENVKRYEKLLELIRTYETLSKAIEIVNELKNIEQVLPILKDILNINVDEYVSTVTMLKERKKELEEALRKLNELEMEFGSWLRKVLEDLGVGIPEDIIKDIPKVIEVLEGYRRKIEQEKSLKEAELSIIKNSANVIEISTKCPLCGRELNKDLKDKVLIDIEQRSSRIVHDVENLDKILNKVKRIIEEVKKFDRSLLELKIKIDNSKKYLEDYLQRYRELKDRIEKILGIAKEVPLLSKCREYSLSIDILKCINKLAIEYTKLYEEKQLTLSRLLGKNVDTQSAISRYDMIKNEIRSLGFDIDRIDIKVVDEEYKKLRFEASEVREKLGKVRGKLESNVKLLDELFKEEKELEKKIASIVKDVEMYPILSPLVNMLLGKEGILAKILTQEARRLMEKYINIVLKEIGMDFKVKIEENFDIKVYSSLGELDVKSLSGGETVSLAIALRIALAYTVFGRLPGFFILDEPTQFLDRERRRAVFEVIKKLSEKVPQVIVVTHDTEVEELADKVYYVSKEGGRSVVKEKENFVEVLVKE